MKILQIFSQYLDYGGEEKVVETIESALKQKFQVFTLYESTKDALGRPLGKIRMPFTMRKNPSVLSRLKDIQESNHYHFWQIHNVFPAISVAVYELANELGVPVVQYLHNYRFGCPRATLFVDGENCEKCIGHNHYVPAIRRRCWRASLPATVALANALHDFHELGLHEKIRGYLAPSATVKEMHGKIGFPADRIHVLPHFLDAGAEPASLPSANGDVLFLGRICEEKGIPLLLDAWKRVSSGSRRLRIVGDGPELTAMRKRVSQENLRDVIFEGFIPPSEHWKLWQKASFFVAPSVWREPFGMVILEAWRHGRPVLATNLGGLCEMITDGRDGWLAPPDSNSFAAGLQRALDAGPYYSEMGLRGRQILKRSYNRQRWIGRATTIYSSMGLASDRTY